MTSVPPPAHEDENLHGEWSEHAKASLDALDESFILMREANKLADAYDVVIKGLRVVQRQASGHYLLVPNYEDVALRHEMIRRLDAFLAELES